MSILVCDGVSLSYGTKEILKDISFSVNEGDKVGIIGVNGAGKSTLAHIIAGSVQPTSGSVYIPGNITVGMLSQRTEDDFRGKTVYDVAVSSFADLVNAEAKLDDMLSRLSERPSLVSEYERLRHDFELKGGNEYKTKVKSMLARFGFPAESWNENADLLSGGQKTRLALASLLMSGKDIVILDEPTNHLDVDTVEWLEGFISSSPKTFLIISHDRYFLDRVTNVTVEIEHLTATKYTGGYTAFKEKKKQLTEIQQKHYELQQKEIKRLEAYIENQIRWGREKNFIAAKSRQKAVDRIERIEKPISPPKTMRLSIHTTTSSHSVLSVRNLSKSFGKLKLFDNLSFEVMNGERVMVIGSNGCGKSTLLKIINGIIEPDSGVCESGYSQVVGYYDQEVQLLDESNTVLGELIDAEPSLLPVEARTILGSYGFHGDDAFKQVSVLSGGERARLSIAKLVLKKVSFLVLDEPTNHLDIPSKEAFEEALAAYEGTILAVSHDRYFINMLGTRIIEIDRNGYDDGYFDFRGNYALFLEKRVKNQPKTASVKVNASRTEYENAKKEKANRKSKEKRYAFLTGEIPRLEEKLKDLENEMTEKASDYVRVGEIDAEMTSVRVLLDGYYDEYLMLEEEREEENDNG